MPLNAISELLKDNLSTTRKHLQTQRFTFDWLSGQILKRQVYGKDTIIIISGPRRAGKSNWGLKLIRAYIKQRKKFEKDRGSEFKWSWKKNFPLTRTQAIDQVEDLYRSFQFFDEGGDQFYTQEGMKRAQRELVKFMNKSGVKMNLTIIVWPDVFTLDQKIVSMADLLVLVPYRFQDMCSFAFIFGKNANPLTYDKFGILKIRKKLEAPSKSSVYSQMAGMDGRMKIKHKKKDIEIPYPKRLFRFLRSIPSFQKSHRFGPVDKRFENAYINNVKDNQLAIQDQDRYVPIVTHNKLKSQYDTLLYNLYTRSDMSYAQIERLHISPVDGAHLRALQGIRASINSIRAML